MKKPLGKVLLGGLLVAVIVGLLYYFLSYRQFGGDFSRSLLLPIAFGFVVGGMFVYSRLSYRGTPVEESGSTRSTTENDRGKKEQEENNKSS